MRLGISGYATAGKDEVATVFEDHGFVRIGMSDALNNYLCILDPIIHPDERYSDYVEEHGYVRAKEHPEVRRLLQVFGTEVGRRIDNDMWVVEMLKLAAQYDNTVTTGIRFMNERSAMDKLIHVHRPGVGPLNDHASEDLSDLIDTADYTIVNDGTLADLRAKTLVVLNHML